MKVIAGIDIGGTKCAVSFAEYRAGEVYALDKAVMPTLREAPAAAIGTFIQIIRERLAQNPGWELEGIGISCGGPLDSRKGLILSPPNLPLWDRVDCVTPLKLAFGVPVGLQNDADACALAEWRWGAGRGASNMIFLTFGTGMGAGLILNGELYIGANNLAGEVGHVRLEADGPDGYDKPGSFEGFCSGGGIANLARMEAQKALAAGRPPVFCKTEQELDTISAKTVADALEQNDALALQIYKTVGRQLGRGLAMLIDVLNPELVVIGSIYVRQHQVLEEEMRAEIAREALPAAAAVCKIVPAGLGELVGDYASISVGASAITKNNLQNSHFAEKIPG